MHENTAVKPPVCQKRFWNKKIMGIPAPYALVFCAIIWGAYALGVIPSDNVSILIFLISITLPLQLIGKNTPVLGKYIGFGALLPLFGSSFLTMFGVVTPEFAGDIKSFVTSVLSPLNVALLMTGAMMGKMSLSTLRKALLRYIPVILAGQIAAILAGGVVGKLLGYNLFEAIATITFPCFSGGTGAPLVYIPPILSEFGRDGDSYVGMMTAALSIGNLISIILCGVLDSLGKLKPSWTGNGNLIRSGAEFDPKDKTEPYDGKMASVQTGIVVAAVFFFVAKALSSVLGDIISINYVVWLVLLGIFCKLFRVLPREIENSLGWASDLVRGVTMPALLAGVGIGVIDMRSTLSALTPSFLLLVASVVVAFVVTSMLVGHLMGLYAIESGISVGCCSCNIGGTGDIICCEVANRMELYPFASISTRIGGALALLILNLVLPYIA